MAAFQHKWDEICPSGAIIAFAAETLDQARNRPVACVLMNAAEVAIFHHEIVYSTNALPPDEVTVLADPNNFWTDGQPKLWLMTYPQLSGILAASRGHPDTGMSLLLHMGCGDYTWNIVKACHVLWKWVWGVEDDKKKANVRVYTISNLEESIYCDASSSRLSTVGLTCPTLQRRHPEAFSAAVGQIQQERDAHWELCKSTQKPQYPLKHTNRAVVFTSKDKLLEAYDQHGCPPRGFVQLGGDMTGSDLSQWVEILLQRKHDIKTLLVEPDVGTIGTVRNLGTVLVLPVRRGFFFDRRLSQVVLRQDVHMSLAELHYARRVAVSPTDSGINRVVSVFTTAEYDMLPSVPTGPPAFTGHFLAILLHFCDHSYFDDDKKSPIRLPTDGDMTDEYLRRMESRGLTERRGGPLTDLGRSTAWWYDSGGVRNFNVANLLAIASTVQGARANALMQIAAVLYHPTSSLMSPIASMLKFQIPEGRSDKFHSLLQKWLKGFPRSYVARGPIWIAIAIWRELRKSLDMFSPLDSDEYNLCQNMLQVSRGMLNVVESNWLGMTQSWTENLGGTEIEKDPIINDEDFLFLEESLVRVLTHNLVLVSMADSELGVFARDITSGSPIAKPDEDLVNWAWLAKETDSESAWTEPDPGVFAVYTVLHRWTGPDGVVKYVPEDLTFVSTQAVRRVLRDMASSQGQEVYQLPKENNLLRTKYPIYLV